MIPITERCWQLFRNQPEKCEKLLEVLAREKVIVLCAYLHRFSAVRREIPYGSIVQIMVVSVVRKSKYLVPPKVITEYGSSLTETVLEWQPETME